MGVIALEDAEDGDFDDWIWPVWVQPYGCERSLVTISASDGAAGEDPLPAESEPNVGEFTVRRIFPDPIDSLIVDFHPIAGTAVHADDYRLFEGDDEIILTPDRSLSVTFAADESEKKITVKPANDIKPEALETVALHLKASTNYSTQPSTAATTNVADTQAKILPDAGQEGVTGGMVLSVKKDAYPHYVSPKKADSVVVLKAQLPAGANQNDYTWVGAQVDPNDRTKATVARDNPGAATVQLKRGNEVVYEVKVWIVWATGGKDPQSPQPAVGVGQGQNMPANKDRHNPPQNGPGSFASMENVWLFQFQIQPASILTDDDRPNLDTPPVGNIPGGDPLRDAPLQGGVRARWDASRRVRIRGFSPNTSHEWYGGDLPYPILTGPIANGDIKADFPAEDWKGNDDAIATEESPMLLNGILKSFDRVNFPSVRRAGGKLNDTIEWRFQFGEFLRLQIGETWFRVSDFVNWRYH